MADEIIVINIEPDQPMTQINVINDLETVELIVNPAVMTAIVQVQFEQNGQITRFTFVQSVLSDEWIVNHNLGAFPVVQVFTSGGEQILADVIHININQLRIYFSVPQTGTVRCF